MIVKQRLWDIRIKLSNDMDGLPRKVAIVPDGVYVIHVSLAED
jgi:hypothetical protein